ncbi:lysozyme inhibitor LprI family protein [Pelagibacterium montanilacus]|uniref:lysozyme inhibitor LprI family protein n=1 Tax=Pelagibacterium montanilacus TaxID=2185280 RepID=UPI0019D0C1C0|nr:lysozyme inhibitor LprI family protein [Pelagibacterium montanilacus]
MTRAGLGLVALLALASASPLAAQDGHIEAFDAGLLEACADEAGDADALSACVGVAADACQEAPGGATTMGIAACLMAESAVWDDRLNTAYGALRDGLADAPADSLRDAQRAWIAFRDADCAFQYALWGEGTMRQIAGASCVLDHTARRAIALEVERDHGN